MSYRLPRRLPYPLVEKEVCTPLAPANEAGAAVAHLFVANHDIVRRHGLHCLIVKVQPAGAIRAGDSDGVVAPGCRVSVVVDNAKQTVHDWLGCTLRC